MAPFNTLFPRPRVLRQREGVYLAGSTLALALPDSWCEVIDADVHSLQSAISLLPPGECRVSIVEETLPEDMNEQGYRLRIESDGIKISANSPAGARHGLRTLRKLLACAEIPQGEIEDWPLLRRRGLQIDLGRVIERPEVIKRLLDIYAGFNYNVLQLYFENAFEFPSHPKLARPFAWTFDQAMDVVDYASSLGISVIPAIQSLGHSGWVTGHPDYAELDECFGSDRTSGILCPSNPRTLEMLRDMVHDVAPLATSGIIHIGMDESFAIGLCPQCAAKRGEMGEGGIFVEHANAVAQFVKSEGKEPAIWGDMFYYYPDDLKNLDKDITIFDWFYYTFERYPSIELFGFPEIDSQRLWRENGHDSWGCPASLWSPMIPFNPPAQSVGNAADWTRYLLESGGDSVMNTQWELSPNSIDYAPPIEGAAAGIFWGMTDAACDELLAAACGQLYGKPQLAPLMQTLGEYRLHGHCMRHWLAVKTISDMVRYASTPADQEIADHLAKLAGEFLAMAGGARNADMIAAFAPAARWLSYQYRKRVLLDEAARSTVAGDFRAAITPIARLRDEAGELEAECRKLWEKNRYPGDVETTSERVKMEASLFTEEIKALEAAASGQPYTGGLGMPVVTVEVVNTHPAIPAFSLASSTDGADFTDPRQRFILQFDSHAARPVSDDELTYAFPVESREDSRFIKLTALGDGQFSLRRVTLHHGDFSRVYHPVAAEGRVENIDGLSRGELALLGHPDPKALFYQLLAEGDSSRIFTEPHGFVIMEM